MNQKQFLKNTLEEQQYQRLLQQQDVKRQTLQQEQELLYEQNKAREYDDYQRKLQTKERQQQLSSAYEMSIQMRKDSQNQQKTKLIQDEYDLINSAKQYQDWQKQTKQSQQLALKRIADASIYDQQKKKSFQQEQLLKDRLQEQLNQRDEEMRQIDKQRQYKEYYRSVAEHQDKVSKNFSDKFCNNPKQSEIDYFVNKGIEEVQKKNDYEQQQKRLAQIQNKNQIRQSLEQQIREKETLSTKDYHSDKMGQSDLWRQEEQMKKRADQQKYHQILSQQVQIKSNGFKTVDSPNYDVSVHNPIFNPLPNNNQNPYLKSPLGQYGNQVLKMY